MTVKINFPDDGAGVEFISSGAVTGEEIIDANSRIYTPEILQRLRYKLVDRTGCTDYQVATREIRAIAAQDNRAASIIPNIIVALISRTDLQYGFSRMWQAFVDENGFLTGLFTDRESALSWIKEKLAEKDRD